MGHDAHGHDAHGHGAAGDAAHAHDGPHELPPEPVVRAITPAPEDFATTPPLGAFLWTFVALGFLVGLLAWHHGRVRCGGWPAFDASAHATGH